MIKIADVVGGLIQRSPFLEEALQEGLINVSALARQLQPEVERQLGKTVKEGAIVMAIHRLPPTPGHSIDRNLRRFFQQLSDISVRSNLVDYTFRNSETLPGRQALLLGRIDQYPNAFYTFSRGISETTIIATDQLAGAVEELFAEEQLLDKETNLSSITLMLPAENRSLYGIYYYVLKALAWEGINLVELISTSNEFSIILSDADLDRAFAILMQLRKK